MNAADVNFLRQLANFHKRFIAFVKLGSLHFEITSLNVTPFYKKKAIPSKEKGGNPYGLETVLQANLNLKTALVPKYPRLGFFEFGTGAVFFCDYEVKTKRA